MLLLAAFGIMIRSAEGLFEHREKPQAITLYILLAVIVIKECLFRFVSREAGVLHSIALSLPIANRRYGRVQPCVTYSN